MTHLQCNMRKGGRKKGLGLGKGKSKRVRENRREREHFQVIKRDSRLQIEARGQINETLESKERAQRDREKHTVGADCLEPVDARY